MKTSNVVHRISEAVFFIALFIEILIVIVDKSALINPIEGRLFQLTFALCMLKIVLTKYNLKEWLLIGAFLALGFFCDQVTDKNEIIRFIAFIAASKGIDGKKALKMVFYTSLVGSMIIILLSLAGVMGSLYLEADYYRGVGIEKRYCLGMGHPNALHCMFWAILTLGIYLYMEKLTWWHYAILMFINSGLFVLTDSRTGFVVSTFSIVCGVIFFLYPRIKEQKWIYFLGIVVLLGCVAFSINTATYTYAQAKERPVMFWLDKKMTGRLTEGGTTGAIEKWSLFSDDSVKGYTDMGYIKLFHWYGIVPASIYLISIIMLIINCCKRKNIAALMMITSFLIHSLPEAHAVSPYFGRNYMIMLFFGVWNEAFYVRRGLPGYFWQLKTIITGRKTLEASSDV